MIDRSAIVARSRELNHLYSAVGDADTPDSEITWAEWGERIGLDTDAMTRLLTMVSEGLENGVALEPAICHALCAAVYIGWALGEAHAVPDAPPEGLS